MKLILALAACLTLTACAYGTKFTYDDARQVQAGMTEQQVTELLGRPSAVMSQGGKQVWMWSYIRSFGSSQVTTVVMENGVVKDVPFIPASFH